MDQIQGRNCTLKVILNGKTIAGLPVKDFKWSGDDEIRKRDLIGLARQQRQLIVHGYKGTFKMDVDNPRHHEIIKYLNEADKNADSSYEFAVQVTESYRDGTVEVYRFVELRFQIPETNVAGRKEDAEVNWTWEANDLVYVS